MAKRKKTTASGVGCFVSFIMIVFIIGVINEINESIGWEGIFFIGLAVIGVWILSGIIRTNREQKKFDDLVLYVLHNRLHLDEARAMNSALTKSGFPRAALIRNLQIIRDSIDIAHTSKKRDTAESRMNLVLERYEEIRTKQSALVSTEVFHEISHVIQEAADGFQTRLCVNIATGHMDKARKLKTDKSKKKYLDLAEETLKEGLGCGTEETELRMMLAQVRNARLG